MKILGIESRASRLQRSGNHQRVIDIIAVDLSNSDRGIVDFHGDGECGRTQNLKGLQCFPRITPGHQDLSSSDRDKFVPDLQIQA